MRVLNRSLAMKVSMAESWTWKDEDGQKLDKEFERLKEIHGQIGKLIQDDWEGLLARYTKLTALMETWTSEENAVANDTAARKARLGEIAKAIGDAAELLGNVQAEPQRLQEEAEVAAKASQKKQLKADGALVNKRLKELSALRGLPVGGKTPPDTSGFDGLLNGFKETIAKGTPLTSDQRNNTLGTKFDAMKAKYEKVAEEWATAEKERLAAEKAEQQKKEREQAKMQATKRSEELAAKQSLWEKEVAAAGLKAKEWEDSLNDEEGPIKRAIVTAGDLLKDDRTKLQGAIKIVKAFTIKSEPDSEKLKAAVVDLEKFASDITKKAQSINAKEAENIALAVDDVAVAVTGRGLPEGTEPRVADVKKAATGRQVPGRHEDVQAGYAFKYRDTEPQKTLQKARAKTRAGEADKWNQVGVWMNELGFGGNARPSSNGPVFLSRCTAAIGGFATHVSQFQANAALPASGLKSSVDEAMDALFADAVGNKGPHITLERSPAFGSPDNARLFKGSGKFHPGNLSAAEQDDVKNKMRSALDSEMARIRTRLQMFLQP